MMDYKYAHDAVAFAVTIIPAILIFGIIIASVLEDDIRVSKGRKK